MKTLIKFWAPLLILFLLSPKTINSQVEKRVIGDCNRTTSSLFSGIDNIVFVKPEGAVYDYNNIVDGTYKLLDEDIFTITVFRLFYQLREEFNVTSIFKSQFSDILDVNTLYVDLEKTKVKIEKNDRKELSWNFSIAYFDSNKKYFYGSSTLGTFYKRKSQWWIEDKDIARRVIETKFDDRFVNLINNPSNACQGITRNYIGDEEIDNINFREAEKSFIKYWEKNYNNDPLEGIYKQSNYYNLYNRDSDRSGILYGDLYRIAITEDETGEFYNVYYLHNNKMEFNIADLIAKIYKTNESNNYEFEYTDIFLNKAGKSKIFRTDRLEFGSYKEPGEERRYRISTKKYDYYEGGSNGYTWRESYKNESNYTIAQRTDGFFIKYNEFDSSLNFDSYFARSFKPKRIYERSPKSNLKKSTRKTTPKKKSVPPDAKIID